MVARAYLVAVVVGLGSGYQSILGGSGGRARQWLLEHSWWQWW